MLLHIQTSFSNLETPAPSASTSTLELPALRLDVRLLVLVRAETEVLEGLAGVLGAPEEEGVGASRSPEGELVESQGLTTGSEDPGAGSGGEAESGDSQLGDGELTVVVGDGADYDDGLVGVLVTDIAGDARDRDRRAVDLGGEEAAENNLVEGSVGPACTIPPNPSETRPSFNSHSHPSPIPLHPEFRS